MHNEESQSRGRRVSWCSERGKTQTQVKAHKCQLSVNNQKASSSLDNGEVGLEAAIL